MSALELKHVERHFRSGSETVHALRDVSFILDNAKSLAVLGPSGSGKSTLLGLVAGLEAPNAGEVSVAGKNLADLNEDALADLRAESIGVIFQQFRLLPDLTALENVLVPLELRGIGTLAQRREKAQHYLAQVGLAERASHRPAQLSGGEQQRVAIARALVIEPTLVVADEPTGSLDAATGKSIADVLFELVNAQSVSLLLVTHDENLAKRAMRIIRLHDGAIKEDSARE